MGKKVSDDTILELYLTGHSQTQIAKMLNMTNSTICKRIKANEFQDRLSECRKQVLDNVLTELVAHSQRSVQVLAELLESENEWARLTAATKILSLAQDITIQKDLMRDIEVIKQAKEYDYIA